MNSGRPPSSDPENRWIWPFELKERLGEGGMGVVYRARYVVNNREVAVKIIPNDVKNPVVLARFERELEILKSLKHPNVVRSFGGVCDNKQRFYAMELVEGGTLEDELQERGRLPWEQVIEYGHEMCEALTYLHQHGVVHRDIKPANFLIGPNRHLKLSDFGLASVAAARRITTAGKTAGTILYMAPEQIRGADITPKTDLYALGCVLYELLTGTPPFVGSTPAATMNLHCHEPTPRVTKIALDCPIALERLIVHLLQKEPQNRPEDAKAVARALSLVTGTVTVVTKQGVLDSDDFRLGSSSDRDSLDTRYKETREVARTESPARWPILVCLLIIAAFAVWNARLRQAKQRAQKSEALWVEAVRNSDRVIQLNALESLGKMRTVSGKSLEAVVESLQAEAPEIRQEAVTALGNMGANARPHMGELHKIRNSDPREEVRAHARAAMEKIQEDRSLDGPGWPAYLCAAVLFVSAGMVLAWKQMNRLLDPPSPVRSRVTIDD